MFFFILTRCGAPGGPRFFAFLNKMLAAALLLSGPLSPRPATARPPLPTVTLHVGGHTIRVEHAATPETLREGLMHRTALAADNGMLFELGEPDIHCFWMKNTPLPLDLIFIGADNRILNIGKGEPYSTASIYSEGPSLAVFEIRGGLSEELGIKPGDLVEWELPEGSSL